MGPMGLGPGPWWGGFVPPLPPGRPSASRASQAQGLLWRNPVMPYNLHIFDVSWMRFNILF